MKKLILPLFLFSFLLMSTSSSAVVSTNETVPQAVDFSSMSKSEMEASLGRKVKLKEWIALKWMSKKAAKTNNYESHGSGRGFAISGMILGILGLIGFNFLLALLGIIFSAIALNRIRRSGDNGARGMAIAGLVTGIIGVVIGLAAISVIFAGFV